MTSAVYYDSPNELALLSVSFADASGNPADPTTVSCVITEPAGIKVTHTYAGTAPADIIKVMTGKYTLSVVCSPSVAGVDGLWGYEWIGTGVVSDVQPGTWRVLPEAVSQVFYVGLDEMKDRLGITDNSEDYALRTSIAAATGWINSYCNRHFNRITEARTYQPTNVWTLDIDDLVDDPSITMSVDMTGTGTYDQAWTRGTDYVLRYGPRQFSPNFDGIPRPFRQLQVVQSGKWLPYTWPYSHLDRVRIFGPWGWPSIPWQVPEACRILSADIFKSKDAPFGIAGVSDLGVTRVQANPLLVEMLHPFVNGRRKVGVLDVRPDHPELLRTGAHGHSRGRVRQGRVLRRAGPVTVTAVQKISHITPKQRAADAANLRKARAALKGRPRTAKQKAASRRNLAVARSAQHARASGKTPAVRKKPAAPAPDTWTRYDVRQGEVSLHALPVCGPVALAEHLLAATGAVASASDIIALWQATDGTTLGELFEAARELGLGGEKLAYFEQCNPDCGAPGLVYGIRLGRGYHAALAAPGGMISWCRFLPRDGTPEEAWWLEWEGG